MNVDRRKELRTLRRHLEEEHPFAVVSQTAYANLDLLRRWHEVDHAKKEEVQR